MITIEVFVVIRGWLTKNQNKYDELHNVTSRHQTWQTLVLQFQSSEFRVL